MASCFCARAEGRTCVLTADYSDQTINGRILPFEITLDMESSRLTPEAGQTQVFTYRVSGVGLDSSLYADLSHLVLSVCQGLTRDMIARLQVTINGIAQAIVWGDNAELRTAASPDPATGCAGLKLDFEVSKTGGEMIIVLELNQTFPVGAMGICLYGAGRTSGGLSVCGPVCGAEESCVATGYQLMDVCVPVTVSPYARVGITASQCCGTPTVTQGTECANAPSESCGFTITQRLCVAVPVSIGANATAGSAAVQCVSSSSENLCDMCGE